MAALGRRDQVRARASDAAALTVAGLAARSGQVEAVGVPRLRARANPGPERNGHASLLAATIAAAH